MPMLHIKTFLVMGHLLGLTLGVGGATIMDIVFLRLIVRGIAIKPTHVNFVRLISRVVTWALVLLWVTGISFEVQYYFISPELIPNPKVYAKLAIVVILTINGIVLHNSVLPIFYQKVGRQLLDELWSRKEILMISCGTISMFSWYTPFFLGVAREMNFVVSAWWILGAYAAIVAGTIAMVLLAVPKLMRLAGQPGTAVAGDMALAQTPSREIPSLEVPAAEMPARKAPSRRAPTREAPAWEGPVRDDVPAWAFSELMVSRPQHSPAMREMATADEADAPLILVRSWPAPAPRAVSSYRRAQPVGSAA